MTFQVFSCNDMEAAWIAQVCSDGEREMAQWEIDEDRDHEERLAREAVEDGDFESWPWYARPPYEVVSPEVIEDAQLAGLPVDTADDEDDDLDEIPVDVAEDDYEE
jgi:hypothetical protein